MKSRGLWLLLLLIVVGLSFWAILYYWGNIGFTKWMGQDEFQQWRLVNLDHQPVYMSAIEGRLDHGQRQWRVRLVPKPQGVRWSWKWFYGIDEKFYQELVDKNVTQQGYRQIWTQSFLNESGERRFQVIFLRIRGKGDVSN